MHATRALEERPSIGYSFCVVGREQRGRRRSVHGERKAPAESERVLDPSVHTLPAGGAVNVSRVTGENGAVLYESRGHSFIDIGAALDVQRVGQMNIVTAVAAEQL